ncbi:MAG: potassium channel family protein [Candidatus Omnitrophica bacterium]|nr:potassium channel family protein [Candidatus Omnitrophota bacterium]
MNPKDLDGLPVALSGKAQSALASELEAHRLRGEGKIDQAFQTFDQAARLYQEGAEPLKAAACFAAAAQCWNIHTGWQPLRNAATRNEYAAVQALEGKDFAYAETLFDEAALLYQKEGDAARHSYCYVRSQDCRLKRLWGTLTHRHARGDTVVRLAGSTRRERVSAGISFLSGAFNGLIWGYGERPLRTVGLAAVIMMISALLYYVSGEVLAEGFVRGISFWEALYMSVMTFASVGYGDYLPLEGARAVAAFEALAGIFLTPLFLIAMTRRFLRP